MNAIINQFRRIYSDDGRGNVDFSEQEEKLRISQEKLKSATQALMRSSNHLTDVLLANGFLLDKKILH